jgi:transcriptional regulator with XRE-family HTH domain
MLGSMGAETRKQIALRNALVAVRNERGITQRELAARLGKGAGTIGRYESGERTPSLAVVTEILDVLDVTGPQREELLAMAHGSGEPRWLAVTMPEQRAMLSALVDAEDSATVITDVSPLLIPGLLQTSDYIRAIMAGGDEVPESERALRVNVRIGRRDLITREHPAQLNILLGEAALRQVIGSPTVMIKQLHYLLEMAEYPNVDLRVVDYRSGWHPALEGPFMVIEGGDGPVAHIENRISGLFLHQKVDVDFYRRAVDLVREIAMSPAQSAELIAKVIKESESMT